MNMHPENKDSLRSIVFGGNSSDTDPTGSDVRPLAAFKVGFPLRGANSRHRATGD